MKLPFKSLGLLLCLCYSQREEMLHQDGSKQHTLHCDVQLFRLPSHLKISDFFIQLRFCRANPLKLSLQFLEQNTSFGNLVSDPHHVSIAFSSIILVLFLFVLQTLQLLRYVLRPLVLWQETIPLLLHSLEAAAAVFI